MDWYGIFKFLHVSFAIVWLGGGLGLIVLGGKAVRARNDAELVRVLENGLYLASHAFVPASAGAVVAGVVMVFLGQDWSEAWIIVGLVGFGVTFSFGNFFIKPRGDRLMEAVLKEGPTPAAAARCRDILALLKFDVVMMFTVVADMVLKPQLDDWGTLLVMALVVAGAGVLFLAPLRRRAVAPA